MVHFETNACEIEFSINSVTVKVPHIWFPWLFIPQGSSSKEIRNVQWPLKQINVCHTSQFVVTIPLCHVCCETGRIFRNVWQSFKCDLITTLRHITDLWSYYSSIRNRSKLDNFYRITVFWEHFI